MLRATPSMLARHIALAFIAAGALAVVLATPSVIHGVSSQGQVTATLSSNAISAVNVTYDFGPFRAANKEEVTAVEVTFPPDTDVAAATAVSPPGTVTITGQTVRIDFAAPVPQRSSKFPVVVGGIVNPSVAGLYSVGDLIFYTADLTGVPTGSTPITCPEYEIVDGWLSLTITTPDPGQAVIFGPLDPGTPSAPADVTVNVDSSTPFTVTRTIGGDATLMGLSVTGAATGLKPAGIADFVDTYQVTLPWTTDPEVPLAATVQYTVVQ